MVAIVSGNSLGLSNSSASLLGQSGALGNAANGKSGERAFVNAATGNLYLDRRDEFLAGVGPNIGMLRSYNSQGLMDDENGDNWRLGL